MLTYLRPTRGLRTVWIDAICINQNDLKERAIQVGKMQDIYARCSQVWLWLGGDIVCTDLQRPPVRYWLHEIGSENIQPRYPNHSDSAMGASEQVQPVTISMLLGRRYFSRVWVIQELALAPRVLIPVGDVLLQADHVTQKRMSTWHETKAPWLSFMASGPFEKRELLQVLRLTSRSEATDIRDKLFGVLGLVGTIQRTMPMSHSLRPDYSISSIHMTTGLIAHLIFNLRQTSLLHAAQGACSTRSPSWLPKLDAQTDWVSAFADQPEEHMELDDLDDAISNEWGRTTGSLEPTAVFSRFGAEYLHSLSFRSPKPTRSVWNQDWSINCKTGTLSLKLTKLLTIASTPTHVLDVNEWGVYRFKQKPSLLVNIASRHPLHKILLQNDEIFVKDFDSGPSPYKQDSNGTGDYERPSLKFLVLRKIHGQDYKLVTCTPYISFFTIAPKGWSRPKRGPNFRRQLPRRESWSVPWQDIGFPKTVADHMKELKKWLDLDLYDNDSTMLGYDALTLKFFGRENSTLWRLLPVLVQVESFESLFENEECQRLRTIFYEPPPSRVTNDGVFRDFCYLKVDEADWCKNNQQWNTEYNTRWDFYEEQTAQWLPGHLLRCATTEDLAKYAAPYGHEVCLRCPILYLQSAIENWQRLLRAKELWNTGLVGKDISTFEARLRGGPRPEDYSCITPFPVEDRHVTDQLEIGTHMREVSIC